MSNLASGEKRRTGRAAAQRAVIFVGQVGFLLATVGTFATLLGMVALLLR